MRKPRIYSVPGTARRACRLCEALGLGRSNDHHSLEPHLDRVNSDLFTHVALGCGLRSRSDATSLMERFRIRGVQLIHFLHSGEDPSAIETSDQVCWLVDDLSHTNLQSVRETDFVLWIPRRTKNLATALRHLPPEFSQRLFVYWPHPQLAKHFAWSWTNSLRAQTFLSQSFPDLALKPMPGLELYNPEIPPDLDLEPPDLPEFDQRSRDFSPKISVVIPTYDNLKRLRYVLREVLRSECDFDFEVIVVDDGSQDGTHAWFSELKSQGAIPDRLVYLRLNRPRRRKMGKGEFRAGIARNVGVKSSRGEILLFLDSDILIPSDYLRQLVEWHKDRDVIQPRRLQLTEEASENPQVHYRTVIPHRDVEPSTGLWQQFQRESQDWDQIRSKWKYASTFCLSIKRRDFVQLGWFKKSFFRYGFEDTDLGFRAAESKLRFHLADANVYHFKHEVNRSEYSNSQKQKEILLKDSCRIFYLNHLDRNILDELSKFVAPDRGLIPRMMEWFE